MSEQAKETRELRMCEAIWSLPEGGRVVFAYPERLSPESYHEVEEWLAILMRNLKRRSIVEQV